LPSQPAAIFTHEGAAVVPNAIAPANRRSVSAAMMSGITVGLL
jgi:hypothetical protein